MTMLLRYGRFWSHCDYSTTDYEARTLCVVSYLVPFTTLAYLRPSAAHHRTTPRRTVDASGYSEY
jgi:hypothetical protein